MMRGWRLFGVAGTIFAYVAGILLLSIISLNSTQQRRLRGGRYSEFDTAKNREGLLGRRPPLQWCSELKYLEVIPNYADLKHPQPIQTFPGHFLKKYKLYLQKKQQPVVYDQPPETSVNLSADQEVPINPENINSIAKKAKKPSREDLIRKEVVPYRPLTALASFPGSGNTWVRYLLQQATGILTGSVYKDYGLLKSGFPAENVCNSSVLVVKTHEWGLQAWQQFQKAILLVRDPDKAIIAEFNRQSGGHVGFASPDRYKRSKGRYWQQFVSNKLWAWEQMNLGWAKNFTGDIKIVFYDDLTENVESTLREMLQFIDYPINNDLITCAIARREGIYRRKKRVMTFDPYSALMRRALEDKRDEVYAILGRIRP